MHQNTPSKAAWCISFFGIQPTLTQVPPRPKADTTALISTQKLLSGCNRNENLVVLNMAGGAAIKGHNL